jgi:hypothetical protein
MDANELRAPQAPLKKQHREQPATVLTPARAEVMLDIDRIVCRVRSWGGETDPGLHPATGGDGSLACSADMILEALVACAGVTVSAVAPIASRGFARAGGFLSFEPPPMIRSAVPVATCSGPSIWRNAPCSLPGAGLAGGFSALHSGGDGRQAAA